MRRFIFIWFLVFGLASAVGGVWIGRSAKLAVGSFQEADFVRDTAQTLVSALDNGGPRALDDVETRTDPKRKLNAFVFDSGLHEVSGRRGADRVRSFAAGLRPQDGPQIQKLAGGLRVGGAVVADQGRAYRIVVRLPSKGGDAPAKEVWTWAARIAVMVVLAGLLCSWLAWRLSTPLLRLRRAARTFATGDLAARAGGKAFAADLPEYQDLARDFDDMAGRIETLVTSQRQLLRDVSHELRTPLTRLGLAVDNARHAGPAEVPASLDRIDREAERLNALIDRILRLSRLEGPVEAPRHEVIELADFIEGIVADADFEAVACQRRVSITRVDLCRLTGDRELLREAIENVLRNAIRYTPQGAAVSVEGCRIGSSYRILVRDCGPGAPEEHLDAIFEPFYRAPQRLYAPGFGLGLAIARRAVGLHQGTIFARNVPEGGFEVAILLPVMAAHSAGPLQTNTPARQRDAINGAG